MEPEVKELTLDEWKAQQQQRIKPEFNIRKAGEGEDTSQWQKMIVLNKKNNKNENLEEEVIEYDPAMYPQRVGRQQRLTNIKINFNDGRRSSGYSNGYRRRGSGAGFARGSPNRGMAPNNNKFGQSNTTNQNKNRRPFNGGGVVVAQNQPRKDSAAPKVNDEQQFPTLA